MKWVGQELNLSDCDCKLFWTHVDIKSKDECWLWTSICRSGKKGSYNYGCFYFRKKLISSHRMAYALKNGAIPRGLLVLHKCDNKRCCNPAHLFLGTHKDNFYDARKKGRISPAMCSGGRRKLTAENVKEILLLIQIGELRKHQIGKMFGVGQDVISKIKHARRWRNITQFGQSPG